ncbi:MAG TPA: hypothetical protein VHF00_00510, partial [Acidimicrobiales bacterium]|nr:hypothetical protein [Acidimicrobiales bacterium]
GLAALLGLVATAVARTARAWRRPAITAPGDRLMLGGAAAGLVGYLVQASANTQPVSLSFFAWVLLGVLCAFSRPPDVASADSAPAEARRRPDAVPAVGSR